MIKTFLLMKKETHSKKMKSLMHEYAFFASKYDFLKQTWFKYCQNNIVK